MSLNYKHLNQAAVDLLMQALTPWFLGESQKSLVRLADEVVDSAYDILYPYINTLQQNVGIIDQEVSALDISKVGYEELAEGTGASLVGFQQSGTGAVPRTVQDKARDIPTLLDFIPVAEHAAIKAGTSTYDCTADLVDAFAAHDSVRAPAGLYNISSFTLGNNKRLLTDGHATIFQQVAGQPVGTRMFVVGGSNVEIGTMTCRGNIATDTDEQQHAIFIQANATVVSLDNIKIGDIRGENIRGDVVYFGQATGGTYKLTNVHIGNVVCDNVYRNGVSCVSADGWSVAGVTGDAVGFCHMDIEANVGSGPCVNGRIGYIKGRVFGAVSPSASDYIDNIEIDVLDLATTHAAQSSPSYAAGAAVKDAFLIRNVKRLRVGKLKVDGYGRCGVFVTYSSGELGCEDLEIGSAYFRNCALTDATYIECIHWNTLQSNRLRIGYLDAVISGTNYRVIAGLRSGQIGSAKIDAQAGAALLRDCQDVSIGYVSQTGAGGFLLSASQRITVSGGTFTGDRLASFTTKCTFANFTATAAVFLFSSGQEDHFISNCTLNGDYYGFGTGIRAHTYPLRFGGYYLWVDANGRLRRKASAPSSDTDGTIAWVASMGVTGSRPTFGASDVGALYLDTTLAAAGKPIWWNGSAWVDATGATV